MNKQKFMIQMSQSKTIKAPEDITNLSAQEYFETEAGKEMMKFIFDEVIFIDEKTFKIINAGITERINSQPLYKGRNFLQDMQDLGFNIEVIDRRYDVVTVETLLFTC